MSKAKTADVAIGFADANDDAVAFALEDEH